VERIEADEELVDRYDAGLHLGLKAMLAAVKRQAVEDDCGQDEACDAPAVVRWDPTSSEVGRARSARTTAAAHLWSTSGVAALARQVVQIAASVEVRLGETCEPMPADVADALARAAHELEVLHDRLAEAAAVCEPATERVAA
jgi:hypothetical protein